MSRTPVSAAPGPPAEDIAPAPTLAERAAGLAGLVRDNPKTAIAAGAAVAAGIAAAAAIPLVRARRKSGNGAAAPKADAANPPARKRAPARKAAKKS